MRRLSWMLAGALGCCVLLVGMERSLAQPDAPSGGETTPSAAALEELVRECSRVPGTRRFAKDVGMRPTVPICALHGAVFWRADFDVDCDGGRNRICRRDPTYQPVTSASDSRGQPLDAATLPYVVIPLPSRRFDYRRAGLQLGSVVVVIYHGRVVFGVFGDEGPEDIIGEGSYALAIALGIDPHPITGGVEDGVTYIAFTGGESVVSTLEDHAEAERIGRERVAQLLAKHAEREPR